MVWYEWLPIVLGIAGIITGTAAGVRFLVKHYFEEIKHELKPNSGSSMKDQVTRLEQSHKRLAEENVEINQKLDKLDNRVEKMFEVILKHFGN